MCRRLCLFWVALATTFSACTTTPASCPSEPFLSGLFAGLNFSYPGLEDAAKALAAGDNETACAAIARYYVTAPTAQWLRPSNPTPTPSTKRTGGWADVIMADNYSFYGTQSLVPRFSGGGLNWSFCPGPTYDPQWMLALNRHGQLPILVEAWLGTGNPVYSRFFDNLVTDWIAYSGTAPATLNNRFACGMRPPDWLTLDTGIRLETPWPQAFFGAQAAGDFSTRTRLTMLASTLQSARYLRDHQSSTANWEATQLRAIAQTALAYPEATASPEWLSFSVSGMIGLLQTSIYPDGVSSEQTTGYDMVALGDFDSMLNLLRSANATFDPKFAALVEQMYTFIAYDVDYEGSISLNGDTDEKNVTDYLLAAARKFNRSDWAYVATRGADGAAPPTPGASSKMFPWAGQFIMRNSYKGAADALTWAWFDVGPFGSSGHAHRDKLHLSMRAFGAHLLVDSGRFTYEGSMAVFREKYALLTQGHNTIQLDGHQQVAVMEVAQSAIPNGSWTIAEEYDRAVSSITFDGLNDTRHTRGLYHDRATGSIVVVDRISTSASRSLDALWHAYPTSNVSFAEPGQSAVVRAHNGATLAIVRGKDELNFRSTVVKGQVSPTIQGWYSNVYNTKAPSPCAIFSANIPAGATTMVWILRPSPSGAPFVPEAPTIDRFNSSGAFITAGFSSSRREQVFVKLDV